jgi:redox-sensing transcriptional repressor
MGNLGSALASYVGFNDDSFEVVAAFDSDPQKIGRNVSGVVVQDTANLPEQALRAQAEIAVLAVPAVAAAVCYEALAECGVRAVLNFAPSPLPSIPGIHLRNVDLRIHLEELSFLLGPANHEEAD